MDRLPYEVIGNVAKYIEKDYDLRNFLKAHENHPGAIKEIHRVDPHSKPFIARDIYSRAFHAARGASQSEGGMNMQEMIEFLRYYYNVIVPEGTERWKLNNIMNGALKEDVSDRMQMFSNFQTQDLRREARVQRPFRKLAKKLAKKRS